MSSYNYTLIKNIYFQRLNKKICSCVRYVLHNSVVSFRACLVGGSSVFILTALHSSENEKNDVSGSVSLLL